MSYTLSGTRQHQKTALSAGHGFNGKIVATLVIVNPATLSFMADVNYETGDVANPNHTITPSDDGGKVKVFGSVDNLITWINGAFSGVADVKINVPDIEVIAKPFAVPSDPIADATRKKAAMLKRQDAANVKLAEATAAVSAAVALGWNAANAHPALQAKYQDLLANKATVQSYVTFYGAEIVRLQAIITP